MEWPASPSSRAAPTTTSPPSATGCRGGMREGLVDAVDAFCERIAFSTAQVERVFEAAAVAGPARQAARRAAERLRRRRTRGALQGVVLRPPRTSGRRRHRRDARRRHGGDAAARRVPFPARDEAAADRRAARGRRRDGGLHRPQPGHVAHAVAAADDPPGLRRLPAHARGGRARRHRATRRARWAWPTAARWPPASAPTSRCGSTSIRASSPTGSAIRPAGAASSAPPTPSAVSQSSETRASLR